MLNVTPRNEGPRGSTDSLLQTRKGKKQAGTKLEMDSRVGAVGRSRGSRWRLGERGFAGSVQVGSMSCTGRAKLNGGLPAGQERPAHPAPRGHRSTWGQRWHLPHCPCPLTLVCYLDAWTCPARKPPSHSCAPFGGPPWLRHMGKGTTCNKVTWQPSAESLRLARP